MSQTIVKRFCTLFAYAWNIFILLDTRVSNSKRTLHAVRSAAHWIYIYVTFSEFTTLHLRFSIVAFPAECPVLTCNRKICICIWFKIGDTIVIRAKFIILNDQNKIDSRLRAGKSRANLRPVAGVDKKGSCRPWRVFPRRNFQQPYKGSPREIDFAYNWQSGTNRATIDNSLYDLLFSLSWKSI